MPGIKPLLAFKDVTLHTAGPVLNWEIRPSEHWLISGDCDAAKNELFEILAGKKKVISGIVSQSLADLNSDYSLSLLKNSVAVNFLHPSVLLPDAFYQQRYHATESDKGISLKEFITAYFKTKKDIERGKSLLRLFQLDERLDEPIIHLSSGEFRKLAIIRGLLKNPRILLLIEPYAGLDIESVEKLDMILLELSKKRINIILASELDHVPAFITHCLNFIVRTLHSKLSNVRTLHATSRLEIQATSQQEIQATSQFKMQATSRLEANSILLPIPQIRDFHFESAIELHDLTIHDGHKKMLDAINWSVKKGEKWALLGHNGAGKSMLLSVIFADHPQAYANHVVLFDRIRGSGESIWDIRDKIAYFSTEYFLYTNKNKTCSELAYGILRSNPYKFNSITKEEVEFYHHLMNYFSLTNYTESTVHSLPPKLQRLAFLIAVFLKNVPLLILDEPFHGFKLSLIEKLNYFLNQYCKDRTLIFVSHRKSEIPSVINKYITLQKGKAEIGSLS
jgi:molybdate transport system ATP-binding protein